MTSTNKDDDDDECRMHINNRTVVRVSVYALPQPPAAP